MSKLSDLETKLGIKFNDSKLLEEALTHRSFLNESREKKIKQNERLEFLGDAVLELAVTEFLFEKFPKKPEGELTALRAALVNARTLFLVADKLNLGNYLRMSKGEAKEKGKSRQVILADAVEALIGAIYLDKGTRPAEKFIKYYVCEMIDGVLENKTWRDAKSLFQERSQEFTGITPTYEVLSESGPDHKKHFAVGVYLEDELMAKGEGFSKQEAQVEAAEKALKVKGWGE
ncbi:MAG: ribonuclease III [Candidatus Tagabacteria bacterium CG09_land_8_20_14_0_10_41_14]|uniref:Ribonuclease 3 n=2 Tax=Candidatus Tagaibacteriota TaxID=1817918 RepID=A0A2H0WKK1_9BACT|nr:MAG: ribonuclease III [Candidatus Tagabacteria bacterium CG09_land_8_20_14_0_10_41_14]PJE73075.1 MAG: ribonuclease III [Candidatus Tagabacteria bacterium CG10_big_fil_rev_8_21_14_0_10_40_13]